MVATSNPNRSYAAAHFALELDNAQSCGLLRSIEGGNLKVDVMTYQQGGIYDRWRQLGKPKFDDIKVQVGMAMSQPFYGWIQNFFAGTPVRKNGAIIAADFYYKERARREFTNAMITELTFPKLEGSDTGAAYMSIGFCVEDIQFAPGKGGALKADEKVSAQKLWKACNFRFRLDGIPGIDGDTACKRVSKIDSFTIKQSVVEYHMGGQLAPTKTPTQIDFPTFSFYLPEADAQPFIDWCSARNGIGNKSRGGQPSSLHGEIVTYDNEGSNGFTLEFTGADIVSVTPDRSDATTEEIKQVKVEVYTESMKFTYPAMEVV
jgi:phage tail-like protein